MKKNNLILFVIRAADHFHYHKTIIASLGRRGYRVRLLLDRKWSKADPLDLLDAYKRENPWFDYGWAEARTYWWHHVLFHTRALLSYRRYLMVEKNKQSMYYRDRVKHHLPDGTQKLLTFSFMEWLLKTRLVAALFRKIERMAPPSREVVEDVRALSPICLIASPVNLRFPHSDLEYLKAAIVLKIPSALPVLSWDNLTTKGLFHAWPDVLLAWNDVQVEEAKEHQDFPAGRIRITGAPVFDVWFTGLKPSVSREEFCRLNGLRSEDPILTYLGSSAHMAKDETWIVEDLRKALDASDDPRIRRTQIIVRPHPKNFAIYDRLELHDTLIHPKEGTLPNTHASLQLFYDTLQYSVAAVDGVNTTAIIETIITGKPGIALLTDTYKKTQGETKHFNQLIDADALEIAHGAGEVPAIVERLLKGEDPRRDKRLAFVARYVRPKGMDREAGDVAAEEIDHLIKAKTN